MSLSRALPSCDEPTRIIVKCTIALPQAQGLSPVHTQTQGLTSPNTNGRTLISPLQRTIPSKKTHSSGWNDLDKSDIHNCTFITIMRPVHDIQYLETQSSKYFEDRITALQHNTQWKSLSNCICTSTIIYRRASRGVLLDNQLLGQHESQKNCPNST